MDLSLDLSTFNLPPWMALSGSFLLALFITWISIPTIVKISKFKKLHAGINERTSHQDDTPNLGGMAVFAGVTLAMIIFSMNSGSDSLIFILGGLIVLFFIGIKDDILIIDPKKKLLGQLVASIIAVWIGGIRITFLYNVFGIGDLAPVAAIVFTVFLFLILINGFNLIDGIDGLASGLGILISAVYGIWFIICGHVTYGMLSLTLAAALTAFFRFNIFSKDKKIFLGDTGSMLIGFIISVLTIQFIDFNLDEGARFQVNSAPAVAYGLLIVPLIDMLRVVILRFWNGKSPFKADRNHIHHTLLHFGYSHLGITIAMVVLTLIFFTGAFLLRNIGVLKLMILLTVLAVIVLSAPWLVLKLSRGQRK